MSPNRVGYVYNAEHFAGTLTEYSLPVGYEYEFQYDAKYINSGMPQLGYNLPVRLAPYRKNHLPTFFANLMSEGWVKQHQARLARLDQDDKFGLLLGHGAELIGPVRILTAPATEPALAPAEVPLPKLVGFTIDFPRREFNEVALQSLDRVSISGVQPKMFLTHAKGKKKTLTNAQGIGPYIVKPSPADFPELAENEFIIMQLCKAVGLKVADHWLVPFSCGENAYVTGRFDVDTQGRMLDFIEDLASAMDVAPGQKSSDRLSYENAILTAYRLSGLHKQVLRDGFLQVLMAYIVGNNDLHLKNFSLQRPRNNNTASGFTPIYDMVSVAPYPAYDGAGELSIWLLESEVDEGFSTTSYQHYGYYTGNDFIAFGQALGLGKLANVLISDLSKKVGKQLDKVLNRSPGSEQLKATIKRRVLERLDTLTRQALPLQGE